jgi:biotin transport system substrate-specific component
MQTSSTLSLAARPASLARSLALGALGVVLLTLSAKAKVPFWPVPMTLQTLVVLAYGAALGERIAVGAVLAYLAVGAVGFPVFAGTPEHGVGLAYMVGPTGGYLVGFLVAAWVVGRFGAGQAFVPRALALLAGVLVIHAFGALWLAKTYDLGQVWAFGVWPFIVVDCVKAAIVACGVSAIEPVLNKLR